MKIGLQNASRAEVTGILLLSAAAVAILIQPLLAAALLLFYVVLCVLACFFPETNFLGHVICRGCTGKNNVALTFDDGPSEPTTRQVLGLLDKYGVQATFFVSGVNAQKFPDLILEICRRGHSIGNHSYSHDPLVMLKSYRKLHHEVFEAQSVLRKMGIDALAFRPPVGIVNPKLFPILKCLGLICINFSCRARDAGNFRVKNIAAGILRKVKGDDIILLHDKPPYRPEDALVLLPEFEKVLIGIKDKGLRVVPLSELIDKEVMRFS